MARRMNFRRACFISCKKTELILKILKKVILNKKVIFLFLFSPVIVIACFISRKKESNTLIYNYERYYEKIIISADSNIENTMAELSLYAGASVAIDADDGHILYGENEFQQMAMASTTKILTAIIALENTDGNEIVTISKNAAGSPKVKLGVKEGEQYYLKDLLLSMMLGSHNDSSVAIAEHIAGSTEEFSKLMNQKAMEIGATDSFFVTPNGLDAENHYSTAYDMALIGSYAIQNEDFVELVNTSSHSFSEINGKSYHSVSNINSYLTIDDTAIGIKTGFTGKAGYCFVGANRYEDKIVVSCVLACGWPPNKTYKWSDMKTLMNAVRENYSNKAVDFPEYTLEIPLTYEFSKQIKVNAEQTNILYNGCESITQIVCIRPSETNSETATGNNSEYSIVSLNEINSDNSTDLGNGYVAEQYILYGNVKKYIENGIEITR